MTSTRQLGCVQNTRTSSTMEGSPTETRATWITRWRIMIRQYPLAQLSQLGEKNERYQHRHSESFHYTALAGRRAIFSGAVIRGGGWGGRSSLRWRARSFWSAVSSV